MVLGFPTVDSYQIETRPRLPSKRFRDQRHDEDWPRDLGIQTIRWIPADRVDRGGGPGGSYTRTSQNIFVTVLLRRHRND